MSVGYISDPNLDGQCWRLPKALHQQVLYLAAQAAARWHLVAQWPRLHEDLGRLLDNLKEAVSPPDWPAKLAEALRESRVNERLLLAWLDARHEASEQD